MKNALKQLWPALKQTLGTALKQMLGSKKAIAMVAGIIVSAAAHIGFDLPPEEVTGILAPILAYIVGQGVADHGKEKEKARAAG